MFKKKKRRFEIFVCDMICAANVHMRRAAIYFIGGKKLNINFVKHKNIS